jgi:DNA-binding NarL/FixJ family response regulator
MVILLCSATESVIKRWTEFLAENHKLQQANSMSELKQKCTDQKFDLLLIHRSMVDTESFKGIRRLIPSSRIFLLSDTPDEEEGLTFIKLGISGYANTYISSARLDEAVRIISHGAVWLGQKVMQRLILDTYARAKEKEGTVSEEKLGKLTNREREIAELVSQGQSNLEVAANLDITERTVKAHLSSIYEKTKTGSRLNLALLINRG